MAAGAGYTQEGPKLRKAAMFKGLVTLCSCITLLGQMIIADFAHADSQNLSHQGNELNTINAQSLSTQTNPEKEKLAKSKTDFAFGAQLGDFSLNYLMFITHYMAGATMPVFCKNSAVTAATGPAGVFLPNLWIDNIIFSIGSIVYLYFELLVYDHLQKKYKALEESLKICPNTSHPEAETGSSSSCQSGEHGDDFHLKALEAQHQALDFELEMLDQKAEATRATKTAWLLSAVLSLATHATVGNYPDICLGMYPATLPFLGPTLQDAFRNFQQQSPAPQGTFFTPASIPNHTSSISKEELLKSLENAKDFDSLVVVLTELQLSKTGVTHSPALNSYFGIHDELAPALSFNVSSNDFLTMKQWLIKALKGELLAKMSAMLINVTPISKAAAATTTEQEFEETLAAKQELTEANNLSDFFSVYKDVSSMFNTTTNMANLTQDSTFAEDYKKLSVDPVGHAQQLIQKMISQQFFKRFADYLGFRNGGETAFLIYLTVVGDLVVLKSRSLLMNPLVPSSFPLVGEGSFLFKIVSSVVGAYFANAYRQELLEAKLKIIELKKTITSTIQAIKDREKDGGVSAAGIPSPRAASKATAESSTTQGTQCLDQTGTLSPDSVGSCPPNNNVNGNPTIPMDFRNSNFDQAIKDVDPTATEASENLKGSFNRIAMGNVKAARGHLKALGDSGAQMAAHLKNGLHSFHKLNPKKNIKDELANAEKNISSRIQMALAAAKYKGGILQISPSSHMSLATMSAPSKNINKVSETAATTSEQLKKTKSADPTSHTTLAKIDWIRKRKQGEIEQASENEFQEAMRKDYEFVQEDINTGAQQNIFDVITLRYFKSAYPVFFKRKDLPEE